MCLRDASIIEDAPVRMHPPMQSARVRSDQTPRLQTFDAAMNKGKVTAERGSAYGHPKDDFSRAARIKAVVAECADPLARHALEMIATKMARLIHTPDHTDSWVDIAGYARTGIMATDPEPATQETPNA